MARAMAKPILALALGAAATLGAAEIAFQLLPVNAGWGNPPPSAELPLIRYFSGAHFTYSRGWAFDNTVHGRFNNYGTVSVFNYAKGRPAVAVIGDSFVEGAMIEGGARVHEVVHAALAPRWQAVGLSQSGADLADHLVAARFALREFETRALVFALNETDFSGAHRPKLRGCWFAETAGEGGIGMNCAADIRLRNLFYSSATLSYLYLNLKFSPRDIVAFHRVAPPAKPAPAPSAARLAPDDAKYAAHFFAELAKLADAAGLDRPRIVIALDSDRARLYAGGSGDAPWRAEAAALAAAQGFGILDLDAVFRDDYARHRRRFDFSPADSHWNAYGHRVIAAAVRRRLAELGVTAPGSGR